MSTGIQNFNEIEESVSIINSLDRALCSLHCISSYPSQTKDMNIISMNKLKKLSNVVGLIRSYIR